VVKFWKRKNNWDKLFSEKIAKRVSKIPTGQLLMWADQSLYSLGTMISAIESNRTDESLENLLEGAEALHAVVYELNKRLRATL
jgi:hypothetical protein